MTRNPVVAGRFYPADPSKLKAMVASFAPKPLPQENALACILPHAGYVFSGKVAVQTLASVKIPEACIILGPNHSGLGEPVSIMREGEWKTPLGRLVIHTEIASELMAQSRYLEEDAIAHAEEHSIEVILPLIQELGGKQTRFVPITLASNDELVYKDIAKSIASCLRKAAGNVLVIASSDMSHYEPQKRANDKDQKAIEAILALDDEELIERVRRWDISMCGYIPAAIAVLASKMAGATSAKLLAYQTSGDVSGDYSSVVGYAGIVIH
ncbi:MAG: AmmeMemoRadiSam system protein B [Candidatus Omnitrophota bacterium]